MNLLGERLPKETGQAWEAWLLYREMEPADRRYADVADRLGKSRALICRWGSRWKWEERAAAWDNHLDQVVRRRVEKERVEMVRRHLEHTRIATDIAVAHFKSIQKRMDAGEDVGLTVKDALALLDWGIKNERLCYGSAAEYLKGVILHKIPVRIQFIKIREQRRDDRGVQTRPLVSKSPGDQISLR